MGRIQLKFKGFTEIARSPEIGILVVTDMSELRQIAIVCDKFMEQAFTIRVGKFPMKRFLLPEVLCAANPRMNTENFELQINSLFMGQYHTVLVDKADNRQIPVRASDGLLIAYIAKLDIFMDADLFVKQSVAYDEGGSKMSLPVNTLSIDMLNMALKKAIEDENYELASNLRDELKRRKEAEHNNGEQPHEEERQ